MLAHATLKSVTARKRMRVWRRRHKLARNVVADGVDGARSREVAVDELDELARSLACVRAGGTRQANCTCAGDKRARKKKNRSHTKQP